MMLSIRRESRKRLPGSVSKCWDRRTSHASAMKNLQDLNLELARVILKNLPDDDPGHLVYIYREQYESLMNDR